VKNALAKISDTFSQKTGAGLFQFALKHRFHFLIGGLLLLIAGAIPHIAFAADEGCSLNPATWGTCAGTTAMAIVLSPVVFISYLLFTFSNWIFWMVAALFNWSVVKLVFQFADFIGNSHSMLIAWGVLRDIGNIALLFGFIFMGIGTILNLHDFSAKKALPALIIFAVLLNFSLFTAEAVIDASNLVGSVMYRAACLQGANCNDTRDVLGQQINVGLAGAITQNMHVGDIFSLGTDNTTNGPDALDYLQRPVEVTIFYLGLAIFVLASAAVFLAGAALLISRAVILCFLMVTSPIGFAGMAIPPLHAIAKRWWDELLCQSLFAPVYLLMIFVSLKLAENLNNTICAGVAGCNAGNLANAVKNGSIEGTGVFVIFGVVLAFMIGSLLVAREFSCIIGSKGIVDTAFKFIGNTSGALAFGSGGFVGRRVFGGGANALNERLLSSEWARKNHTQARLLSGLLAGTAAASIDGRGLLKGAGLDLGSPGKAASHGFHGIEEKAIKERTDFAEKLTQTKEEKEQEAIFKEQRKGLVDSGAQLKKDWEEERLKRREAINTARTAAAAETNPTKRAALETDAKSQEAQLKVREAQHDREVRTNTEAIKALDERLQEVDSNAGRRAYAEQLHERTVNKQNLAWPSVERHADHAAFEAIMKKLNRSDSDKVADAIKGLEGKLGGGGGGGGGHGGGGGGHTPKPKASAAPAH
jgi:hypothetical protein